MLARDQEALLSGAEQVFNSTLNLLSAPMTFHRHSLAWAHLPLAAACVLPNPDFDPQATATAPSTTVELDTDLSGSTSGDPETTSSTSPGTTSPGTTEAEMTTGSTTGDTESDGGSTEASDDTEEPQGCWGLPADEWSMSELQDAKLGWDPTSPHVSPDGLTLYYMAAPSEGDRRWIHRSSRASTDEPFAVGEPLVKWPSFLHEFGHPNVTLGETEIILAVTVGAQPNDLWYSVHDGDVFPPPAAFVGLPNTIAYNEDIASISEDGARMIVQRNDGPANDLLSLTWSFVELERPPNPAPGTPFGEAKKVELPPITEVPGHVTLCPTLSPDGLHLFFGSTYPINPSPRESAEILRVFSTERADLNSPWDAPVEITSVADDDPNFDFETCPTSVTRDGCQLFIHRFQFGDAEKAEDSYRIVVATRAP